MGSAFCTVCQPKYTTDEDTPPKKNGYAQDP